jgi:hypothetical protein
VVVLVLLTKAETVVMVLQVMLLAVVVEAVLT